MANDEFSINQLEPSRKNESAVEENGNQNDGSVSDASLLNQEATVLEEKKIEKLEQSEDKKESYQGSTIKEVIANSVNPVYQGPTAKEIVVNSVKIDNTKNKNWLGLFALIVVLVLIGVIVFFEVFGEDNKKRNVDYLEGLPEWSETYRDYLNERYKNVVTYNITFLDFDFDNKPEALVNYIDDGKTVYEVIDALDKQYVVIGEVSDVLMLYSFDNEDVVWYINTSFNDNDMKLIDLGKRLSNEADFEVNLTLDNLSQFKSNHFTLSYQIKYTKVSFRTVDQNLAQAVKMYETEIANVNSIVNNIIEKYSDDV